MFNKAFAAMSTKANSDLTNLAATERDKKKQESKELAIVKGNEEAVAKLKKETRMVLFNYAQK